MSNFVILRTKKLKTASGVNLSLKHGYREQPTPNADTEARGHNSELVSADRDEALAKFNNRLATQKTIRKNGVLAVEYLVTASPEAMAAKTRPEQDAYLTDSLKWIKQKHGEENVIAAVVHRDENTNPHLSVWVVPIDKKGKLNCREFLGGADKMQAMQTEFAEKVGKVHSFERGLQGSKATHAAVKKFYGRVREATPEPKSITIPEPKVIEGKGAYGERVGQFVYDHLRVDMEILRAKAVERDAAVKKASDEKKLVDSLTAENQRTHRRLASLEHLARIFTKEEIDKARARKERYEREEAERRAASNQKVERDDWPSGPSR